MTNIERPDLSQVSAEILAYIESLEAEVSRLGEIKKRIPSDEIAFEQSEPPTSMNVVTISHHGMGKRTPRHFYSRQRRGGMGVFDLATSKEDHSTLEAIADENQHLLLFTNFGRAFRLPVSTLTEKAIRGRGQSLGDLLPFRPNERIMSALPDHGGDFAILASHRGWVRRVRSSYLGKSLIPGMTFHDIKEGGHLTAACWTKGDGDLFMVSRQGKGIRFSESQVPGRGCLGMRVDHG